MAYVDQALERMKHEFERESSYFFTENDLVCFFYRLLLSEMPDPVAKDADGRKHLIVHMEYPTPFRCDMREGDFELKKDDEVTDGKKPFKRGHYDIAVLNPNIISKLTYDEIKGQDYVLFKEKVLEDESIAKPVILYGIEFAYRRDPISWRGVEKLSKEVFQDHQKLLESRIPTRKGFNHNGFIENLRTMVFVRSPENDEAVDKLESMFNREGITLCVGEPPLEANSNRRLVHRRVEQNLVDKMWIG